MKARGRGRLSVLALSSRFDGPAEMIPLVAVSTDFQYSLCRVVLMVARLGVDLWRQQALSVLALSSRFDGQRNVEYGFALNDFQYSLCRVVLMVPARVRRLMEAGESFSTRSVESF